MTLPPHACLGGLWASDLLEASDDPACLETGGRWAVQLPYEGQPEFLRFARWQSHPPAFLADASWQGPRWNEWQSSLDKAAYCSAVDQARQAIARGDVYQVNVCRVLSAPRPVGVPAALFARILERNPAPYAGLIAGRDRAVVSASPELFLRRVGANISSGPIKGTGRTEIDLLPKDSAENIMIVDLVRNDLGRICRTGSVGVPRLLDIEEHPGLVHLVSEVAGQLRDDCRWTDIIESTFPPGSVTGAPKSSALGLIDVLENASREAYCGAIGWVDVDAQEAELAVSIRTFWMDDSRISFGTGAGITWASDPIAEWDETVLKAERLIKLASVPRREDA